MLYVIVDKLLIHAIVVLMRRQRVIDLQVLHVPVHLRSSMIIQCK